MRKTSSKTIIVCEDDVMLAKAINVVLLPRGYNVITANDGVAAEEAIRHNKPDCVLMDIMMPKKTGFEVMESLHKDGLLKKFPVIILSNLSQEEDIKKGLQLGAADYFNKGDTDITKIVDKIDEVIKKKS